MLRISQYYLNISQHYFWLTESAIGKETASENERKDSDSGLSEEDKILFNGLISKAKQKAKDGELDKALKLYEKAYSIHGSDKLKRKIDRLKVSFKCY